MTVSNVYVIWWWEPLTTIIPAEEHTQYTYINMHVAPIVSHITVMTLYK